MQYRVHRFGKTSKGALILPHFRHAFAEAVEFADSHGFGDGGLGTRRREGQGEYPGVKVAVWEESGISITEVVIDEEAGARMMGKPLGRYITLECGAVRAEGPEMRRAVSSLLAEELARMLPGGDQPVMVVGLGNRQVTPDSLGPMTVDRTLVTRHIFQELPDSVDERMQPVCAIARGFWA